MLKKILIILLASFTMSSLWSQTESYVISKTEFSTNKYAEFSPVYYQDGLVFCSNRDHGLLNYSDSSDNYFINIYYVDTAGISENQHPELLSGELNTKFNDGPVSFDSTERTVYFTRNLILKGGVKKVSSRWNKLGIFKSEYRDGSWSEPREFRLNTKKFNLFTPCLSPDGQYLFFASDMPEGFGGSDIYYCEWKKGYWGNPVNMGSSINTPGNEAYPYLNSSGELFFSSDGYPGYGKKDILVTTKNDTGWAQPILLDPPINSKDDDFGILTDNLMIGGYFSSDRDGSPDIFKFRTIYPQLFSKNYQREENFCYLFHREDHPEVDTSLVHFRWQFENGESQNGSRTGKCYPGPGKYKVYFDIADNTSEHLFFRNSEFLLNIRDSKEPTILSPSAGVRNQEINFRASAKEFPGYRVTDYAWDFGDKTRKHGEKVSHSYPEKGEYDVNLFLTLQSGATGETKKTWVTKKVLIMSDPDEKEAWLNKAADSTTSYLDIQKAEDTDLEVKFNAGKHQTEPAVFAVEILSSPKPLDMNSPELEGVPEKYIIKERQDERTKNYSYSIMQRPELMEVYPAYKEMTNLGFSKAQARMYILKEPEDRALFNVLKNYSTWLDAVFINEDELSANAYSMLDDIARFMKEYPDVKLEVSVHTNSEGLASANLSRSQLQAKKLSDYIISRAVDKNRLRTWGYGGSKPIASKDDEEGRRKNERVEFRIMK